MTTLFAVRLKPRHPIQKWSIPLRVSVSMLVLACSVATAQPAPRSAQIPSVIVAAKANPNPVEKSYRKMVKGVDLFEREHDRAPLATLRFKLLPRKQGTDMNSVTLALVGDTVDYTIPIATDYTFVLPRDALAMAEDAQVVPNRKKLTMTWRTDIRTPGLPANTRRLGDLRLECRVGMEAGLISNSTTLLGKLTSALFDTPAYCDKQAPMYLFFADQPLASVAIVDGQRRQAWPFDKLYAQATDAAELRDNLPYCDCEVLLSRTYVLPLGDKSWPDDSLVEFEYKREESTVETQ